MRAERPHLMRYFILATHRTVNYNQIDSFAHLASTAPPLEKTAVAMNEGDKPDLADFMPEELSEPGPTALDPEPTSATDEVKDELTEEATETEEEAEEEEKESKPSFLSQVSPYTVLLLIALVAMLLAGLCLFSVWNRYGRDTKAKNWRQQASVSQPFSPGTTIAARTA